jgi:hypothetical protein
MGEWAVVRGENLGLAVDAARLDDPADDGLEARVRPSTQHRHCALGGPSEAMPASCGGPAGHGGFEVTGWEGEFAHSQWFSEWGPVTNTDYNGWLTRQVTLQ